MIDQPSKYATDAAQHADAMRRFNLSVLPHFDAAYNLARWLTGNVSDAQDVTQEAMLRAFRFVDGFHGGDARAWLLTIVRHAAYSWLERHRPQQLAAVSETALDAAEQSGAIEPAPSPESVLNDQHAHALLLELMNELPLPFREVLVLRELEELSYREIAAVTDLPVGTVMSRLARARLQLRAAWARRGLEETKHGL